MKLLTALTGKASWEKPPPVPVPDLGREAPALIRPEGRATWQLLYQGFGNPWLRVPQAQNLRLYEQLAETIPLLNAALTRIVHLVGAPCVEAEPEVKADIDLWMRNVSVNRIQTGLSNWFMTWLRADLLYGRTHSEIILPANRKDIYALQQLHTRSIDLRPAPDLYSLQLVQNQIYGTNLQPLNPKVILTAAHDVDNDSPQGNSLFFGLPFVAEIVTSMAKDLRGTWERFGNPSYHIRYLPPDTLADPHGTIQSRLMATMMSRWNALQRARAEGNVGDFGTAGDVEVRVIGAAGEQLEFATPWRTLLEQIVAKTGLPPMMLGLQWQAGERIGAVQAGLVSAMIDAIRGSVCGEIEYLIRLRQQLVGRSDQFKLTWRDITLIEAIETARADLMTAQADSVKLTTLQNKWRLGAYTQLEAARELRPDLAALSDDQLLANLPDLLAVPPMPVAPTALGQGAEEPGAGQSGGNQPSGTRSLTYGREIVKNGRH